MYERVRPFLAFPPSFALLSYVPWNGSGQEMAGQERGHIWANLKISAPSSHSYTSSYKPTQETGVKEASNSENIQTKTSGTVQSLPWDFFSDLIYHFFFPIRYTLKRFKSFLSPCGPIWQYNIQPTAIVSPLCPSIVDCLESLQTWTNWNLDYYVVVAAAAAKVGGV